MQQAENPIYTINDFFDEYSAALERRDTKYMAASYALPCMFISDGASHAYTTEVALEALINQSKRFYATHDIQAATPDVRSKRQITGKIVQVAVNWAYTDAAGALIYECDYYYLLRLDKTNSWKIEVAIPLNEKEKIDALNAVLAP